MPTKTAGLAISNCEVCGSNQFQEVLDLGFHPMCDDLLPIESTRLCDQYPIVILYCENCRTAHQKYQIPKRELFPDSYHYRSRLTGDVLNGMQDLVSSVISNVNSLSGKVVVDIGCNDGSLLNFFSSHDAITVGVEPTDAAKDIDPNLHIFTIISLIEVASLINKKYPKIDIITFTNVFAHIENLPALLVALKSIMSPNTLLVVENHYLGSVLDTNQFDTFYHEHPRTYSLSSFFEIAKSLDRKVSSVNFPRRYGGNIRVFISNQDMMIIT